MLSVAEACTRVWIIWVLILSSACPWNVPSNGSARLLGHNCDSRKDSKYHHIMTQYIMKQCTIIHVDKAI